MVVFKLYLWFCIFYFSFTLSPSLSLTKSLPLSPIRSPEQTVLSLLELVVQLFQVHLSKPYEGR